MTNRICRSGGSFFIMSGSTGVLMEGKDKKIFDTSYNGTAIRMIIDPTTINNLQDHLAKYRAEGDAIAKNYKIETPMGASTASMMLSKDFLEVE
jgi:hypothetical protein